MGCGAVDPSGLWSCGVLWSHLVERIVAHVGRDDRVAWSGMPCPQHLFYFVVLAYAAANLIAAHKIIHWQAQTTYKPTQIIEQHTN